MMYWISILRETDDQEEFHVPVVLEQLVPDPREVASMIILEH